MLFLDVQWTRYGTFVIYIFGGHRVKFGLGGTLCVYFVATDKAVRGMPFCSVSRAFLGNQTMKFAPGNCFFVAKTSVYTFSLRESLISCFIFTQIAPQKVFLPSFYYKNILKQWLNCESLSRAEGLSFLFKDAVHLSI